MNLKIDGVECGYIKNGKSISFEKEPGQHEIIIQVEVYKSAPIKIDLKENENKEILVSTPQKSDTLLLVFMIGLLVIIILDLMNFQSTFHTVIKYILFSMPLLQIIYYSTIAKGKFITVKVID